MEGGGRWLGVRDPPWASLKDLEWKVEMKQAKMKRRGTYINTYQVLDSSMTKLKWDEEIIQGAGAAVSHHHEPHDASPSGGLGRVLCSLTQHCIP